MRHSAILIALFFAGLLLPIAASAQENTPPTATIDPASAAAPETVNLTLITEQSLNTDRLVEQIRQLVASPPEMETVAAQLPQSREQVRNLKKESAGLLENDNASTEQVRTAQGQWQYLREQLNREQQVLKQRAAALETGISQLAQEDERWQQIRTQASAAPVLPDSQKSFQKASNDLSATRKLLVAPLQETLALHKQWQELLDTADEQQISLRQHEDRLRKHLLTTMQEPLWQLQKEDFSISEGTHEAVMRQVTLTGQYLLLHPGRGLITVCSAFAMLIFLWRLRVRRSNLQDGMESLHLRLPLIDRPLSTTVATTVALALLIYPRQPQLLHSTLSLLLFIPVVRLGLSRIPPAVHPLAWLVSLFFAINNLSVLSEAIPALQRLWMVACAAISAGVCIHALRKLAASEERNSLLWRSLRSALWLSLATALIAIIAGFAGAATLAQFLTTGVANSAYAGLCMVVVAGILGDLAVAALYLPYSTSSRLLERNRPLLVGRLGKLATFVCAIAWINFTLGQFLLKEPLWQFVSAALNEQLTVGNLAISLGDVMAVVVTVWLSFKLSQLLRFIFLEDIAPRARLARGVPEAIATMMHYTVILIGFMLAISAAGIDMSKLAIMAGALGVGIGIGLQDVVNNFTSGMILLFEQHIKQGDIIQCSAVNGRVIRIGLRSSVVRTFDGAEVIVPNSQLVSAQVINWTHSDQQRRITIPVGVAYGSNPEQVINALLDAARNDSEILRDPTPTAFFLRFGPSTMDFELRAWVSSGETLNEVTSRLCVEILRQLEQKGIMIPFPQQDVHVRSLPEGFGR